MQTPRASFATGNKTKVPSKGPRPHLKVGQVETRRVLIPKTPSPYSSNPALDPAKGKTKTTVPTTEESTDQVAANIISLSTFLAGLGMGWLAQLPPSMALGLNATSAVLSRLWMGWKLAQKPSNEVPPSACLGLEGTADPERDFGHQAYRVMRLLESYGSWQLDTRPPAELDHAFAQSRYGDLLRMIQCLMPETRAQRVLSEHHAWMQQEAEANPAGANEPEPPEVAMVRLAGRVTHLAVQVTIELNRANRPIGEEHGKREHVVGPPFERVEGAWPTFDSAPPFNRKTHPTGFATEAAATCASIEAQVSRVETDILNRGVAAQMSRPRTWLRYVATLRLLDKVAVMAQGKLPDDTWKQLAALLNWEGLDLDAPNPMTATQRLRKVAEILEDALRSATPSS